MPFFAFFKRSMALYVFPVLVSPKWIITFLFIALASLYSSFGFSGKFFSNSSPTILGIWSLVSTVINPELRKEL